ncbi:hypothetical protein T484DRAFT_2458991 [Baffinella frigidus]|nr:hypothetical protein T484DRAFT_2458991 [Cryptophyta sp. CCMP2293]
MYVYIYVGTYSIYKSLVSQGNRVAAVVPGGVEPLVVHAVFGQEVSPGHEALSPQLAPPLPLEQPGGQSAASAGIVRRVLATPQSRSRSPTATMDNFLAYLRKCKQWAPVLVFFTVVILRKLFYAYFSRPPPIAPPITPPVVPPIVPLNVSPVDGGDAAKQIVEDFTPQEILRALLDESGGGDVADVDTESWRVYRPFQVLSGLVAVGTAAISTLRL